MAVYIVFDVETPNRANDRMSAIGISAIKDNKIVANYFSLVDPETHFDYFNTKLTDFFLILKCLKHADSAVICVFFVRSMNLQHCICQQLILSRLFFAFQIVVECLSADLQSFAVKADFSDIFAVIGSICNIFQSLFFPDF